MIKKIYKRSIGLLLAAAMMLSAAGCGKDAAPATDKAQAATVATAKTEYAETENAEFEQYIKDSFEEDVLSDSSTYNQNIKDFSTYGFERPAKGYWMKDMPTGSAEEMFETEKKKTQERYDKLMQFEGAALTEEEYFTFMTEKTYLEFALKSYEYTLYTEQFYPGRGLQANIGTVFAEYSFREKQDIEDYLTLMDTFPEIVDYCVKIENWRADQGYAMQDAMADKVIEQCDTFLENKDNHYLIQEFDRKIDELEFLSADEKADFKKRDKESIKHVFEGMETIKKTVAGNKGKSSVEGGICKYKEGRDYYNDYIIPYFAGSDKTGDELIAQFDKRIGELVTEQTMIMQNKPDLYQYYAQHAGKDLYGDFDSKEVTEQINELQSKTLSENYPELPEIQYHASYLSPVLSEIMDQTAAYYMHPAYDDLDNNVIRVNQNNTINMWLLLAHEGCPGHMFQFNYFMSTNPNPLRKKAYYLGYLEGWAVYSSNNTFYDFDFPGTDDDETLAKILYIDAEFNYLVTERVDLGINYEGWDLEQLKQWLTEHGLNGAAAEALYDSIITTDPGLYLSYSQGFYEMKGMREYAEKQLGAKFDVKEYHKVILSAGPCMYKDLKFKVDEYIAENK
ncbi:MAG: DUF885 domain-containing protein [Eubacterium sp.]|nr:DUF885 domain-containing protein [Eubacterium sp.]